MIFPFSFGFFYPFLFLVSKTFFPNIFFGVSTKFQTFFRASEKFQTFFKASAKFQTFF